MLSFVIVKLSIIATLFSTLLYCDHLNLELPSKDSPETEVQTEQVLGMKEMIVPLFAGILSALRRVIARRVSLKVLIFC